jgi:ribosome-associated heat shock protein Hsp15
MKEKAEAQQTPETVRVDRWLWAVRICKTRSRAADLCGRGRVLVDGQPVKPSRPVKPGQVVGLKKDGILWQYGVLRCVGQRVGAPAAALCREDRTPAEDIEKSQAIRRGRSPARPPGMGRPTKKDRRDLDNFLNQRRED